jgi:hypothetical protein
MDVFLNLCTFAHMLMVFKVYEQLIAMLFEHKLVICFYELLITVILETLTGTLNNILFEVIVRRSPVSIHHGMR